MRAFPSGDLGPVDRPPCSGQRHAPRLVLIAVALHRSPRQRGEVKAPQTCFGIARPLFYSS